MVRTALTLFRYEGVPSFTALKRGVLVLIQFCDGQVASEGTYAWGRYCGVKFKKV